MRATETTPPVIEVRDLGRMPYRKAFDLQKRLQQAVIVARSGAVPPPMPVLFVEHDPPVITISRRAGARDHLRARPEELSAAGVVVEATDRGGDITYHGPGQLVVYPILDLNRLGLRLHSYMRFLEQIVIDVLDRFDIPGQRDTLATGVWVEGAGGDRTRKICAMGVRVSRWVSMHGLALNVTTNLDHFELIVPCGLAGRAVTSIASERPEDVPSMVEVKSAMAEALASRVADAMHA